MTGMMEDIKAVQDDTMKELVIQTEAIEKIDDNVTQVDKDVTAAHSEIVKAESHQKGTGKCIYIVVGVVVLVVITIVLIVVFSTK
jgi:t-SNARE complex subunit (syntaxin)